MTNTGNSQPPVNFVVNGELEHRSKRVAEKISENLHIIANEPSLALYRLQEHVRKSLPQLVEKRCEVNRMHQDLQGKCYDAEYAVNAVKSLQASSAHFQNIHDLLKNAIFMKQQLTYEENRRQDRKCQASMYQRLSSLSLDLADLPAALRPVASVLSASNYDNSSATSHASQSKLTWENSPDIVIKTLPNGIHLLTVGRGPLIDKECRTVIE